MSSRDARMRGRSPARIPALNRGEGSWSSLDELDVEGDGDIFADEDAAGLKRCVPVEAEILAVDLGGGGETDAGVAPGVLGRLARALDIKLHSLGYAVHRQFAGHLI